MDRSSRRSFTVVGPCGGRRTDGALGRVGVGADQAASAAWCLRPSERSYVVEGMQTGLPRWK
jgi:hypothetical protein